jgi:UDP-N-acetylglucosamine 2-epimerase (non-hydrolysing)
VNLLHVVGARPNFMKAAPTLRAFASYSGVKQFLVHTGQHYDVNMSEVFFQQLEIRAPDTNLAVGSGTHAQQTAEIMLRFEPMAVERKPDLVLVYGDVNSTVAVALVCSKLLIPVAHVEAGLRSFDRTMPEEINRLLTDQIADLLFTPSEDADRNLLREGIAPEKIHLAGNVMIDSLLQLLPVANAHTPPDLPERFALVTLHRPSNVDDFAWLEQMLITLSELSGELVIIFPVHPRTRQRICTLNIAQKLNSNLRLLDPLPYLDFLALQRLATLVITDSGGIQEETTFLRVPCLTVRENTERPITVTSGTNTLVGRDPQRLRDEIAGILGGNIKKAVVPPLWDGHAGERIARTVVGNLVVA